MMLDNTDRTGSRVDLLVFELADLRLALDLTVVREVARAVLILPLPGAPPVVEGVIDVRGEIVPVYDLRRRFGRPPAPLHPDQRLIMAWTGERMVSLRCDRTGWVETVDAAAVQQAEPLAHDHATVVGVARLEDGLVLVQDLAAFLDDAERSSLDAALAQHAEQDR